MMLSHKPMQIQGSFAARFSNNIRSCSAFQLLSKIPTGNQMDVTSYGARADMCFLAIAQIALPVLATSDVFKVVGPHGVCNAVVNHRTQEALL
jgi:hypothetical protein